MQSSIDPAPRQKGCMCTFLSDRATFKHQNVVRIAYRTDPGG
jgi:hypothetical protein